MDYVWLAGGAGALAALAVGTALWRRRSSDRRASRQAHEAAQEREPPVELGETYELGITDFSEHYTGERVAVGKVEGFVVFVEDIPSGLSEGDVIEATITSFNRGRTSADATFAG